MYKCTLVLNNKFEWIEYVKKYIKAHQLHYR